MKFRVWCPESGETEEDAIEVERDAPSAAAEHYAAGHDRDGDHAICQGNNDLVVMVRSLGTETSPIAWCVSGELVPYYDAQKAKTCPLCGNAWPACDMLLPFAEGSKDRVRVHRACQRKADAAARAGL